MKRTGALPSHGQNAWKIIFLNAKIRYGAKNPVLVPDGTHFAPLLE
jgi:hypothetical protein